MYRTNNERKNINYECNEKKIKSKKRMKKIKIIIKKIKIFKRIKMESLKRMEKM